MKHETFEPYRGEIEESEKAPKWLGNIASQETSGQMMLYPQGRSSGRGK